jgi:phosphoribosylanthranilate isomerase
MANEAEAALAAMLGASAVGLVGAMPSGPGPIPDEDIARIARAVPASVHTFLLTSEQRPQAIVAHHARTGTTAIQIVDSLDEGTHAEIRERLPQVKLVQVIHVSGAMSIDDALSAAPHVDALLLDSGRPNLAVKELGGTGRRHDWAISRQIRAAVEVPVFLAGGLRAENVREAIHTVEPFGIDVCSGVRTDGRLDETKLRAFVRAAGAELAPVQERMAL